MITVDDGGSTQAAIQVLEKLAAMLGPSREAVLIVNQRTEDILFSQQNQGRDVLTWQDEEAQSALEIAEVHVARARDAGGNVNAGTAAAEAMWKEIGGYYRDRIAAKINDRAHVNKKALSDNPPGHGYASQKAARWGAGRPILVASGETRDDVKDAEVEVRNR